MTRNYVVKQSASRQHDVVSRRRLAKNGVVTKKRFRVKNTVVTTLCRVKTVSCQDGAVSKRCRETRFLLNTTSCQNGAVSKWCSANMTVCKQVGVSTRLRPKMISWQHGVVSRRQRVKRDVVPVRCRFETASCQHGIVSRRHRAKTRQGQDDVVSTRRRAKTTSCQKRCPVNTMS